MAEDFETIQHTPFVLAPPTLVTATKKRRCALHRYHSPKNLTVEEHHIVPQAWQHFWWPSKDPSPHSHTVIAEKLWAPQTITLAPSCHRNVHFWLVEMMKNSTSEEPLDCKLALHTSRFTREMGIAYQGICRWRDAGGSLIALREAKLWGVA